jgi:predicted transposase YdaD
MKHSLEVLRDKMVDRFTSEGERKGERQKALEIARAMRAEGIDVDTVVRLTGLMVDDVLRL